MKKANKKYISPTRLKVPYSNRNYVTIKLVTERYFSKFKKFLQDFTIFKKGSKIMYSKKMEAFFLASKLLKMI